MRRALAAAALAAGLAQACTPGGGDGAVPTAPPPRSPGDVDPALLQPLTALGPCQPQPPAAEGGPVDGLVLPDGAVLTSIQGTGPLTQVQGWIPMTPVQIRVDYQRRGDVEILQVEDEIREAEVLLTNGDRRVFVKAQALCEQASVFVAVVAPADASESVPVPAGSPQPG
jgi:hypothetical protein